MTAATNNIIFSFFIFCCSAQLHAQDTTRKKTIEVTSTFKPALRPISKMNFTAAAANVDTLRPKLVYAVPIQNLAFAYTPVPLKPLAYLDTLPIENNKAWLKLGYGNYATPYLKGAIGFGDGVKSNGSILADYISQKGKLPHQQYLKYGVNANAIFNINERQQFSLNGGVNGLTTYKFGYRPESLSFKKDSLKQQFSDVNIGAGFSNLKNTEAPMYYDASIAAHLFSDKADGRESQFNFNVPFQKNFGDNLNLQLGVSGMLDNFKSKTNTINNNLFQVNASAKYVINETIKVRAGLIPGWNNGEFKLLPDVEAEFLINNNKFVFQTGLKGYYTENTYRSLVAFNPWIAQPASLNNTRNTEFFGAIKAVLHEHLFFRVKAAYIKMANVPLFLNDVGDGKTFRTVFEPDMNNINVSGEMAWHIGDKFDWYNSVAINTYGNLERYDKAYGLQPFLLNSSLRTTVAKGLALKADVYAFGASWYRTSAGANSKGQSGFDANAGLEFKLIKHVDLWLQFNNLLNSNDERWHQYQVLGFQVLGGVIVHL